MSKYYIDNDLGAVPDNEFDLDLNDSSLNGNASPSLAEEYRFCLADFNKLFFSQYNIDYVGDYFSVKQHDIRIVSHPSETKTCFDKAEILTPWDPLNVIKAFYLECSTNDSLYVVVIPETGCFIDKARIKEILNLPEDSILRKAKDLPDNMTYGTCSPFIVDADALENDGRVEKILFDTETLVIKKNDNTLDDFSFGLDHRLSLQINYYQCFKMLKSRFPNVVSDEEILNLSFKEKFVRKKGKIRITYDFDSLNYRTAKFINSIHGFGDVSISNDFMDELDLPEVLTIPKST